MIPTRLEIRKDCEHFEVCSILGRGCSNWISDPCVYFCASHNIQSERDKVLVYSRIIKPPINFPCITRRELALKDFEDNDAEQSWTSLGFKLENGDEIRVYRTIRQEEQG